MHILDKDIPGRQFWYYGALWKRTIFPRWSFWKKNI